MKTGFLLRLSAWLLVSAPMLGAATISYDVTMNTIPLMGHPAGPFALNFQLNDGSGANDGNNTAVLSGFQFGGGSASGSPALAGGASGNLATSVTITDSAFFNSFTQPFVAGTQLRFTAQITNNVDAGPTPDQFSFSILDRTGAELPSVSTFFDVFVTIDITSPNLTVRSFASDPTRIPAGGGPTITMAAAQVQAQGVPEPGTLFLAGCAMAFMIVKRRRGGRQA